MHHHIEIGKMNVFVIGIGYVGLPLAIRAAEAGFNVVGYDTDVKKISMLQKGISTSSDFSEKYLLDLLRKRKIIFTSNLPTATENSIIVIAVPTPLDSDKRPDLSILSGACEIVAKFVKNNSLIINESTSYIGTLRQLIKPLIDSHSGLNNLFYAVAPERIDPGSLNWDISNTPRIISGLNEEATEKALSFYKTFCQQVISVSKAEIAEAAKLFENTFRQVNIALVNELSQIANKLDFSMHETIMASATKPFGFMPFYPSIGVGGHCIPVDPSYLSYSAEKLGIEAKFINLANSINLSMPRLVAHRINSFLKGGIGGKKIQLAGVSYKPNVSDLRESPALELIKELENLGASISWHDPHVAGYGNYKSEPLSTNIDLGLIITPHDNIDFSIWEKNGTIVLDLSANSMNYGWPKFL